MYLELYETWRKEEEENEVQNLKKDFYSRLSRYLKDLEEETGRYDEKSLKGRLIRQELRRASELARDLTSMRLNKIVESATLRHGIINPNNLEAKEKTLYEQLIGSAGDARRWIKDIEGGKSDKEEQKKRDIRNTVIRFSSNTPPIVGIDMKTYGPFEIEDIASIPLENTEALIKQKLAKKVNLP